MFREIFLTTGTELVQYRLDNLNNRLRGLTLPTRDELQATVISALNAV